MLDKIWLIIGVVYLVGYIVFDSLIKANMLKRIQNKEYNFNNLYYYCFFGTVFTVLTVCAVFMTMKYIGYTYDEITYIERNLVWLVLFIISIMNLKMYYNLVYMLIKDKKQDTKDMQIETYKR